MEAGLPIDIGLPIVIAVMMLAVGMGLRVEDFAAVLLRPVAVGIGLFGMFVAFPLLALAIAASTSLDPALKVGLVLLAASPSASTSTIFTYLARGDVALAVTLTAVSKILPVVTIPLYVSIAANLLGGESTEVPTSFADTSESVALTILLPTAIGMLLRAGFPQVVRIRPHVTRLGVAALIVLIGVLVFRERASLPRMISDAGPAAVCLCVLGMLWGTISAALFGLPRAQRTAITIEIGMQSGGTAIAIASGLLGSPAMAVPAAVYSLAMYVLAGGYVLIERARQSRTELPPMPEPHTESSGRAP